MLALLIGGVPNAIAEKLEDRYIVQPVQGGLLYFILPYEVPGQQKNPPVELDVTYITGQDSVRVNMTVLHDVVLTADSIVFATKNAFTVTDFETFFIDRRGKKYMHRYSCRFPYVYWQRMYAESHPFCLQVHAKEGLLKYRFSSGKWERERIWMGQVLQLINRNRQFR